MKRPLAIAGALTVLLLLPACDPEEQGRPLFFTGAYQGPAKPALSEEKREALARRVRFQSGVTAAVARPPPRTTEPAARPTPTVRGGTTMSPWGAGASVRIGDGS